MLGLALAATLWWIVFGGGDDEAAERVLTAATSEQRTALALSAFFYGNIPLLLGLVAMAAGVGQAIGHAARLTTWCAIRGRGVLTWNVRPGDLQRSAVRSETSPAMASAVSSKYSRRPR